MAKCAICEKGAHFGNNVSHSHRRSSKMWKSNVKSVKVKVDGGAKKMYDPSITFALIYDPHQSLLKMLQLHKFYRWSLH